MRYLMIMAMALGALALPSSAFATHGGAGRNCPAPSGKTSTGNLSPVPGTTARAYVHTNPTTLVKGGACVDFNGLAAAGPVRFDGGTVEAGAGEDPGTAAGDPGLVPGQPDAYAVVDGDDDNADPSGLSDGYVGVSNWETSNDRTTQSECESSGPNNGTAPSSNSGGCLGLDTGQWVYVPGDLPTPICGNTSGNAWDGSGNQGSHNRDGCQIP